MTGQSMQARSRISADRVAALILIVLFSAYGFYGSGLESSLGVDVVGPDFFPKAVAILGVFISGILLIRRPKASESDKRSDSSTELWAFVPIALMLGYVLSLDFLGFPIATFVFLGLSARYLGCPTWIAAMAFGLVSTIAAVLLFRYGLVLRLPKGDLIWFW
jgi:putative tricarboxylic transport membrane protein